MVHVVLEFFPLADKLLLEKRRPLQVLLEHLRLLCSLLYEVGERALRICQHFNLLDELAVFVLQLAHL